MGNVNTSQATEDISDSDIGESDDDQAESSDAEIGEWQPMLDLDPLFDVHSLSGLAARIENSPEQNALQKNRRKLLRWLENGRNMDAEYITLGQFCEFLLEPPMKYEDCAEIFRQLDVEGDGQLDVLQLRKTLSIYPSEGPFTDISIMVTALKLCSLTPGMVDVYSSHSMDTRHHATSILDFLLRHRAPSHVLPCPVMTAISSVVTTRKLVLKENFARLAECATEDDGTSRKLTSLRTKQCIVSCELSSNSENADRLLDENNTSTWCSNGRAGTHWIRLKIAKGIIVSKLFIKVNSSDSSYMPERVAVFGCCSTVGKQHTLKETTIPLFVSGFYLILQNAKVHYPFILVRIVRCHSEGCDTKIHAIKAVGYRIDKDVAGMSVPPSDVGSTMASWYLRILTSTTMSCLAVSPALKNTILGHTKMALANMSPLSLMASSKERPAFISNQMLDEMSTFLHNLSQHDAESQMAADWLSCLLEFCLCRGHVASTLTLLTDIYKRECELDVSALLQKMTAVKEKLMRRYARPLKLTLVDCDGGSKDDSSTALNVLIQDNVTEFVSDEGKTKVNMMFASDSAQPCLEITKTVIRVEKGPRAAKRGIVFVFQTQRDADHCFASTDYDSWQETDFKNYLKTKYKDDARSEITVSDGRWSGPVGFFELETNETVVSVDLPSSVIGQYVVIMFFGPRESSAERLQVTSVTFYGFQRKSSLDVTMYCHEVTSAPIHSRAVIRHVLTFMLSVLADQPTKGRSSSGFHLDVKDLSLEPFWNAYQQLQDREIRICLLRILDSLLPSLGKSANTVASEFFVCLCSLIDASSDNEADLVDAAKSVVLNGAAAFFPDDEERRHRLIALVQTSSSSGCRESLKITLRSLCLYYSSSSANNLLNLPSTVTAEFDATPVLKLIEMLLSISHDDRQKCLESSSQQASSCQLEHLICSLQSRLLAWCQQCLSDNADDDRRHRDQNAADDESHLIVQAVIVRYVSLVVAHVNSLLRSLSASALASIPSKELLILLEGSSLSTVFPQLILILDHVSDYMTSAMRVKLLSTLKPTVREFHQFVKQRADLAASLEETKDPDDNYLKSWVEESPHPYENDSIITKSYVYHSASEFVVEFDDRCRTEKRYDYLEFKDSHGKTVKCDDKVGTSSWPKVLKFTNCSRLQFSFHSDSSGVDWGYKFKVIAKGMVKAPVEWLFDANISLCKLLGKLCAVTLDNKAAIGSGKDSASAEDTKQLEVELLKSELWTTVFRGGYVVKQLERSLSGRHMAGDFSVANSFILSLLDTDDTTAQEFLQKCRQHYRHHHPFIGGDDINETIHTVFVALLWHTPMLREDIDRYVKSEYQGKLSEGIHQAFVAAESLRMYLLEQQQSEKVAEVEKNDKSEANVVQLMKSKASFLLQFAGCVSVQSIVEGKVKLGRRASSFSQQNSETDDSALLMSAILDKFPTFRIVLEFVKESSWCQHKVEALLKRRAVEAQATAEVYLFVAEFLQLVSDSHVFQVTTVALLQELLHRQHGFQRHYAGSVDGCGLKLEADVRRAYYAVLRRLIESVREHGQNTQHTSYDYITACLLHFLDVDWQCYDMPFISELQVPDLLLKIMIDYQSDASTKQFQAECEDISEELYQKHMEWVDIFKRSTTPSHRDQDERVEIQQCKARYSYALDSGFGCDSCCKIPLHVRYRCLQCPDVDICTQCFDLGIVPTSGGHIADHELVLFWYRCDACDGFIVGTRVHCLECDDFDLCLGCFNASRTPKSHSVDHQVEKFTTMKVKQNAQDLTLTRITTYNHHHAKLLLSSLVLSVTGLLHGKNCPQTVHVEYFNTASQLLIHCFDIVITRLATTTKLDETVAENLLGLIAAMISQAHLMSAHVLDVLFSKDMLLKLVDIMSGKFDIDRKSQILALGVLCKLLQKIESTDVVNGLTLPASHEQTSGQSPPMVNIAQYLFSFAEACFQRDGLEWVKCLVSLIQKLQSSHAWKDVMQKQLSDCMHQLKQTAGVSSIFALYTICGFPQMTLMGMSVTYTARIGKEQRDGIVLKCLPTKDKTELVDCCSRRRTTVPDELISESSACVSHLLNENNLMLFVDVVVNAVRMLRANDVLSTESVWSLALVIKSVVMAAVDADGECSIISLLMHQHEFVESVSYLAQLGTGLSRKWHVKDLELLTLKLYASSSTGGSDHVGSDILDAAIAVKPLEDEADSAEIDSVELLADIDDENVRAAFRILHETEELSPAILRAVYEIRGSNVLEELDIEDIVNPSEEIRERAKQLRQSKPPTDTVKDDDTDVGLVLPRCTLPSHTTNMNSKEAGEVVLTKEEQECRPLLSSSSSKTSESTRSARDSTKAQSASLLKQSLVKMCKQPRDAVNQHLLKVNRAIAILYARQLLVELCAHWPKVTSDQPMTVLAALGCSDEQYLPFVLDLLYTEQLNSKLQPIVDVVLDGCKPDGLAALALTSCDFIDDLARVTVTRQSPSAAEQPTAEETASSSAAEKPSDSTTVSPTKQPGAGSSDDAGESSSSSVPVEDKVCISGAVCLKVHFDHTSCSGSGGDASYKLVIASSADYTCNPCVFSGPDVSAWKDCEIPGDCLYYKMTGFTESSSVSRFKFTVSGSTPGSFDIGYVVLCSIFNISSVFHKLPVDIVWSRLVIITCRQTANRRLKVIQLLLKLLSICTTSSGDTITVNLGLLKPLWHLYLKLTSKYSSSDNAMRPPLLRALTELFLAVEVAAEKLGVVTEYLTTVDNAAGNSSDGPNLVRELAEAERKSEYGSCGSNSPKQSSSSSSSSDDDDDDDDDDGDHLSDMFNPDAMWM